MLPILVGGRNTLTTDKPVLTIGSFWPYAMNPLELH